MTRRVPPPKARGNDKHCFVAFRKHPNFVGSFYIHKLFSTVIHIEPEKLIVRGDKFKDASIFYNDVSHIKVKDIKRWLKISGEIRWDNKKT